jgi:hypothetical protein
MRMSCWMGWTRWRVAGEGPHDAAELDWAERGAHVEFAVVTAMANTADHGVHDAGGYDLWGDVDAAGSGACAGEGVCEDGCGVGGQIEEMIAQQKAAREAGDSGAIEKHGVATGRRR